MEGYSNDILSMFWSNIEHGKAVMSEFCKSDDEDSDNDDVEAIDSFYDLEAITPSNDNEEAEANGGPDDCNSLEDFIVDEGEDLNEEDEEEGGGGDGGKRGQRRMKKIRRLKAAKIAWPDD
jgi:hypothetical protein